MYKRIYSTHYLKLKYNGERHLEKLNELVNYAVEKKGVKIEFLTPESKEKKILIRMVIIGENEVEMKIKHAEILGAIRKTMYRVPYEVTFLIGNVDEKLRDIQAKAERYKVNKNEKA